MDNLTIGLVGPCTSGKTSIKNHLASVTSYNFRHIAQEHSFAPSMWRKITNPDFLIFLDVSFEESMRRRPMNWTEKDFLEQQRRLAHAKENADLYINTEGKSIPEICDIILEFINSISRN